MIRALSYDGTGYWLMTKRISRGKFAHWPTGQHALSATSARELRIILGGGSWRSPDVPEGASSATQSSSLASGRVSTTITPNAS